MSDLNQALVDIRAIRRQMAEATEFRGYGPLTLFGTAVAALVAGAAQACWLPDPASDPVKYVTLWLATAVVSAGLIAMQALTRANRLHSGMADEMLRMAVAQFLPAAFLGVILPFVLLRFAASALWLLPGLWQIIFGLGVFASSRCLPRAMYVAGGWFLMTGLICIALGDARAVAPAAMAIPYAVGMSLVAAIHHLSAKKAEADGEEER
ncbi:MAG TPA: hypothetical protein VN612_12645 [Acidobacteriaceae bacterium]|nr:hypothetical protein [Acidobacteriaceae bacterium]